MLLFLCAGATCTYSTTTTTTHTHLCVSIFHVGCTGAVIEKIHYEYEADSLSPFPAGAEFENNRGEFVKKRFVYGTRWLYSVLSLPVPTIIWKYMLEWLWMFDVYEPVFFYFYCSGLKPSTRTLQTNAVYFNVERFYDTLGRVTGETLSGTCTFFWWPMLTSTFWNKDLWIVRSTLGVVHEHLWCIFRIFRVFRVGVVPCTWHSLFYTILLWQCRKNWTVEHPSSPPKNTTTRDG